ncbi:MAG: aminomethyl-transferring glycine dehydrogenase subunit GcvPA [Spirochaetales bacterium]|nr:aminomethyl-transferring glycine dehydrogenase subunit GcvPA [Spirochaetales bacterium]
MYSYIPHTDDDIRRMLNRIGVGSVNELFSDIPARLRISGTLDLDAGRPEQEVYGAFAELAAANRPLCCFAGAGSYDHYIPAAVQDLISRPGFSTAYTPYQAEISQGVLQAIFEFQTFICLLSGLDVSNASLYDGFTAGAEACSMALQKHKQADTILVSDTVHPYLFQVIQTYLSGSGIRLHRIAAKEGRTSRESLRDQLDEHVAAVVVQTPNFNGIIEDLSGFAGFVHQNKSYFLVSVNPLSLALLRSPAEWGADIAFGEGQCLGLPMNFGGPGVGFLAAGQDFMRQMPGRIVGKTIDRDGRDAYVLTLQAREQHIKRERASSNICSNQALAALAVSVFLAMCGETGLAELAEENRNGFDYFRKALCAETPVTELYSGPYFNEAAFNVPRAREYRARMLEKGFLPGIQMSGLTGGSEDAVLFAVTEKRSRAEIDSFIAASRGFYNENAV